MDSSNAAGSAITQASDRNDPKTFSEVLPEELVCIEGSRKKRGVGSKPRSSKPSNLIGLAFSGGGIRSATFNLGILQALAEKKLLHKFDYLSTVSGGGYVGSWLAALTLRYTRADPGTSADPGAMFAKVEQALSPGKYEPNQRAEPTVLHWLRMYSNYLTPHTGVVSGDTWAMIGTWLRNVILNQSILGMLFVSVYLLCMSALTALISIPDENDGLYLFGAAGLVLFAASVAMALQVVRVGPAHQILRNFFERISITVTVMLPFVVACILLNCALWQRTDFSEQPTWCWAVAGALFYFIVWGFVAIMAGVRRKLPTPDGKPVTKVVSIKALVFFSPFAGAAGGCLLKAYCLLLNQPEFLDSDEWLVLVFGTGAVMAIVLFVGALHHGLVGRGSGDLLREWWARLGGYLMLITLGWLLLAGTCAFAPLAVRWALFKLRGISVAAGLLWIVQNYLGIKAAKSGKTSGRESGNPKASGDGGQKPADSAGSSGIMKALKSPRVLDVLAKVAPYVFLMGLILLLTTIMHIVLGLSFDAAHLKELWRLDSGFSWDRLSGDYWRILGSGASVYLASIGVIFFLGGLALSWRVDVNDFSLHHFYRNRLVRCYLGASNTDRRPEPFTGFDPDDDVPLSEFADNYPGPYPILNSALNITSGEDLGYATRRAKSFVFTPLYCGYQLGFARSGAERFKCDDGFAPTFADTKLGRTERGIDKFHDEQGISLGTAMAISGAAASPNMGYYTTPATAFFMALFDVRLGWWMGNPRKLEKWKKPGPALGLPYLLSEVFAQSDQKKSFVYLSDGGHFENLAVYELIRRHCRLIVACDAGADPHYQFDDMLSLIEKARTDFGARIEIDYAAIRPADGGRQSKKNWVAGTIYYDPNDNTDTGTLILIKASMPDSTTAATAAASLGHRKLPDDVWRYYQLHQTFPHQSTADQWFDELQFESYRALGEFIGVSAVREIGMAIDAVLS
jgi:hypothetical protein